MKTITGKQILDGLAENASAWLVQLFQWVLGLEVERIIGHRVTWAHLLTAALLLGAVAAVNAMATSVLRRQIKRAAQEGEQRLWRGVLLEALEKPLYLLIWVYGLYFALNPIVAAIGDAEGIHPFRWFLDRGFDLGVFLGLFWLCFRFTHVIEARLKAWTSKTASKVGDLVVPLLGRILRVIVPVVGFILILPMIGLAPESTSVLAKASSILIIGTVSYILLQAVSLGEKAVLVQYDITATDNLQARKVYTQVHVLSKTIYIVIGIFTITSVLMLFEEVRRFGTSILASAGVVGIIIGFAAQRTIANLFAGFQLAMTQPIRLDDVVIVEGEWGRIEEINLTYVVLRIWDDRRLVVPLSYFIEKPFQNWTRTSAEILGSVIVWVDYSLPVAETRATVKRIVESCKDWDRRFWNVQVTDATDRALQVRVLATAADASKAWDLRCEIREKLIEFIQKSYPQCLPRVRAELRNGPRSENDNARIESLL